MSAHAVQMPSLAGLRLSAATGAPGDPSSDSGRSTPPPAVLQMYGNLQSAAALAEQAKLVLAQAREAAADERKAAAAAAKASAAASRGRGAGGRAGRCRTTSRRPRTRSCGRRTSSSSRRPARTRWSAVKVVMQKLEWAPRTRAASCPRGTGSGCLRELFEAQKTIDRTAQTWAQLSKNRRKYKEQLALIEEAREWRESARPAARKMGNILKQRKVDKSKFERDMAKHAKRRKGGKGAAAAHRPRKKRVAAARAAADAGGA